MDAVRALIVARVSQKGLNLAQLSRQVGRSHSYLQQFLRRGIPTSLPEDTREKLAPLLEVPADALRGAVPGKGAPRDTPPDAIALTADEREVLRTFRGLSPAAQKRALLILPTLD